MKNFMKTMLSSIQAWTRGEIRNSTADWSQNDPNADNYIKNRTHWEEESICIIPEMIVSISEDGGYTTLKDPCPVLIVGQTYTVVLNGVTYKCVARKYNDNDALLGNGTIYGDGDINHGEPFSIDSYYNSSIYLNVATAGKYTISISKGDNIIHKLDSKYLDLPTNLATTDDVWEAVNVADEAQNTANIALANAATAQSTADDKMDKNNPVGTGSFSMNRQANSNVGNYSTAFGQGTVAQNLNEFVIGQNNVFETVYKLESQGSLLSLQPNDLIYYSEAVEVDSSRTIHLIDPKQAYTSSLPVNTYIISYPKSTSGSRAFYVQSKSSHSSGQYILDTIQYEAGVATDKTSRYAHIVGNGTSNTARSNAHTLDWNGNAWYSGDVYVGSTSGIDMDDGSKKLATEEYVNTSIANKITVPQNAVTGDLLTYDGTNWVRISKADLIAEIIAALPNAEEASF